MSKPNEQIPSLVADNLDALRRLCTLVDSRSDSGQLYRCLSSSYLARFKLWAGTLGAHRTSGARSLEYRLRDASSVRKHLVSLLQELKDILVGEALPLLQYENDTENQRHEGNSVDGELADLFGMGSEDEFDPSTEGSKNELSDVLSGVGNVISCLLRLSVTIRNPAPHDHFKFRAGVELTRSFEPYDIRHVRDKYPLMQPILSERLGRLLSHRRRYFKYREDHHFRLKQGLEGDLDDGASKDLATTVASSLPQELKDAPQRLVAVVDDGQSENSATSYAPSVQGGSDLKVPPIPKQYTDGPFLCPFCFVFISVDSRNEWKKHVFRDLRPYACLVEACMVDHDFQRRKDWTRHMLQDHWRVWICPFGCFGEYVSSSGLRDHIHGSHTAEVIVQDMETTVRLSSVAKASLAEGPCPLCHDFQIRSSREYESHVRHHLEQLALFVLPAHGDYDDEDEDEFDDEQPGPSETEEPGQLARLISSSASQAEEIDPYPEQASPLIDDSKDVETQSQHTINSATQSDPKSMGIATSTEESEIGVPNTDLLAGPTAAPNSNQQLRQLPPEIQAQIMEIENQIRAKFPNISQPQAHGQALHIMQQRLIQNQLARKNVAQNATDALTGSLQQQEGMAKGMPAAASPHQYAQMLRQHTQQQTAECRRAAMDARAEGSRLQPEGAGEPEETVIHEPSRRTVRKRERPRENDFEEGSVK